MRRASLVVILLTVGGCNFFPTPPNAIITCDATDPCPEPMQCQLTLGRCVEVLDTMGPAIQLGTPTFHSAIPSLVVTRLGPRSTLEFDFDVGEPMPQLPEVEASVPDVRCSIVSTPPTLESAIQGGAFTVRCTSLASAASDGPLRIAVTALDLSRVAKRVESETITLDATPPSEPDPRDGGAWVQVTPWGDELEAAPRTELHFERTRDPGMVLVEQADNAEFSPTLLSAPSDGGTAFGSLARLDVAGSIPTVTAVDEAANVSASLPVREVRWVATFAVPPDGINPHRLLSMRASTNALRGEDFIDHSSATDTANVVIRPGVPIVAYGAAQWQRTSWFNSVGPAGGVRGVYDPVRARVVRFGGANDALDATTTSDFVHEWSGGDWRRASFSGAQGAPGGRLYGAMGWDPERKGVMVVGGRGPGAAGSSGLIDVWLWSGGWTRLDDYTDQLRAGRSKAVLFYSPSHRAMMLLGGVLPTGERPTNSALVERPAAAASAGWRGLQLPQVGLPIGAAAASDLLTNQPYVFGGSLNDGGGEVPTNTLWTEQPDGGWDQLGVGAQPAPAPRESAALAWDGRRARLLLSGGRGANGQLLGDLWEFSLVDGGTWFELDAGVGPGPRAEHALVAEAATNQVLLFGVAGDAGTVFNRLDNDTWALQNDRWVLAGRTVVAPTRLISPALVPQPDGGLRTFTRGPGTSDVTLGGGWDATPLSPVAALGWMLETPDAGAPWAFSNTRPSFYESTPSGWVLRFSVDAGTRNDQVNFALVAAVAARTTDGGEFEIYEHSDDGGRIERKIVSAAGITSRSAVAGSFALTVPFGPGRPATLIGTGADQARLYLESAPATEPKLPTPGTPLSLGRSVERDSLLVAGLTSAAGAVDPGLWEFKPDAGEWERLPLVDVEGEGTPAFGEECSVGTGRRFTIITRRPSGDVSVGPLRTDLSPVGGVWELDLERQRPALVLRFALASLPKDLRLLSVHLRGDVQGRAGTAAQPDGARIAARLMGYWSAPVFATNRQSFTPFDVSFKVDELAPLIRVWGELAFRIQPASNNGQTAARVGVRDPVLELRYER